MFCQSFFDSLYTTSNLSFLTNLQTFYRTNSPVMVSNFIYVVCSLICLHCSFFRFFFRSFVRFFYKQVIQKTNVFICHKLVSCKYCFSIGTLLRTRYQYFREADCPPTMGDHSIYGYVYILYLYPSVEQCQVGLLSFSSETVMKSFIKSEIAILSYLLKHILSQGTHDLKKIIEHASGLVRIYLF